MNLKRFDRFMAMMRPGEDKLPDLRGTNTTQDIPGAQPDAYGKLRNIKGRDYNNISDIVGAKPSFKEKPPLYNREHYGLITKDVTNQDKKIYIKNSNPLDPRYVLSTKSGRKQIIGDVPEAHPKKQKSRLRGVDTKRALRTNDIEGARPFYKRESVPYSNPKKSEENLPETNTIDQTFTTPSKIFCSF